MPIEPIAQLFGLGARFRQYRESLDRGPSPRDPRVNAADAVVDDVVISSLARSHSQSPSQPESSGGTEEPYLLQAIAPQEPASPAVDTTEFLAWLREVFERAHGREIAAMAPQGADVMPEPPVIAVPPPVLPPVSLLPPPPAPTSLPASPAETTSPLTTTPTSPEASPTRYGHDLLIKRLNAYIDSLQVDDALTARWLASVLRDLLQKHQLS